MATTKAAKKTVTAKTTKKKVATVPAAKKAAAAKAAVKTAKATTNKLGTKKVSVTKGKGVNAKAEVKKPSAPSKLAAKVKVASVDRKAKAVIEAKKPASSQPKLVSNQAVPAAKMLKSPKKEAAKGFAVNEYVVYPTHGVGKITALEVERIGEHELRVFVINFEKDKMTLRVPVGRAEAAGLRAISPMDQITRALSTLKGRAKIARGMWSRRAQEYESKINSGNIVAIAEVVRDLHKNVDQSERSYSERMIYETALHRLVGEVAAAEQGDVQSTQERLLKVLRKQAA